MPTAFQFCPSCGADILPAQDRHCRECGAALAAHPTTARPARPQPNTLVPAPVASNTETGRDGGNVVWGLLIGFFTGIIGVFVLLFIVPRERRADKLFGAWLGLGAGAIVVVAFALALGAVSGSASATSKSDEAAVLELTELQRRLFREERYTEVYQYYSPSYKSICSLEEFAAPLRSSVQRGFEPWKVSYSDVAVKVEGDRAYVTATLRYEDRVAYYSAADPDIYVRIEGRWYDEVDSHTDCSE